MRKTARKAGYIGQGPTIVTRLIQEIAQKKDKILDFGAGYCRQTQILRDQGFNVTSYDFGPDRTALRSEYDIVMVSNVLNIQASELSLITTLWQIRDTMAVDAIAIMNYPVSPRYLPWLTSIKLHSLLVFLYQDVEIIKGPLKPGKNMVFKCLSNHQEITA